MKRIFDVLKVFGQYMLWDVFSDKTLELRFQNTNTFQLNSLHKSGVKLLKNRKTLKNRILNLPRKSGAKPLKKRISNWSTKVEQNFEKPQNFETPNPEFAPQKRSKTLKNKLSYTLWKIIVRIHCVKRTTSYPLGNKSLIIHLIELVPS